MQRALFTRLGLLLGVVASECTGVRSHTQYLIYLCLFSFVSLHPPPNPLSLSSFLSSSRPSSHPTRSSHYAALPATLIAAYIDTQTHANSTRLAKFRHQLRAAHHSYVWLRVFRVALLGALNNPALAARAEAMDRKSRDGSSLQVRFFASICFCLLLFASVCFCLLLFAG